MKPTFSFIRSICASLCLFQAVVHILVVPVEAQQLAVLYEFTGGLDGSLPNGLVRDAAGNLYGTTFFGGSSNQGTVFKLSRSGTLKILYSFKGGRDGANPQAGLLLDLTSHALYGTTYRGGNNVGTVFKLDKTRKEILLHRFQGQSDGAAPHASLIKDDAGNLYGTTEGGGTNFDGVIFKLDAAGNETVLYNFTAGSDGAGPVARLLRDRQGNLYGTTATGIYPFYGGSVFKLDTSGKLSVLYDFTSFDDGEYPQGGLLAGGATLAYGTTNEGGNPSCFPYNLLGCGLVYRMEANGTRTTLYSFAGPPSDGALPSGELIRDSSGNMYGTTQSGGSDEGPCAPVGCGTIFKLDRIGNETVLHSFNGSDGLGPYGEALVIDPEGNLYGTTSAGGTGNCNGGCGVIFKWTP